MEILMLDLKFTKSAIPSHWSLQLSLNSSSPCLTPKTMVPKLKNQV